MFFQYDSVYYRAESTFQSPKSHEEGKMQRRTGFLILVSVFLCIMSFVGCFAFVKSDHFGSWEQFLMKYAVGQYYDQLAEELVGSYRPAQPATKDWDGAAHLWAVDLDRVFYRIRRVYLKDKFGDGYEEDPWSEEIKEGRKDFVAFVGRSMTSERVRGLVKFLPEIVSRMVEVARHPVAKKGRVYSNDQIREMLLLYAEEAVEAAQYCSFVISLETSKDQTIGILELYEKCSGRDDYNACGFGTDFGKKLRETVARQWNIDWRKVALSTFLWAMRRRQDGGNELLQAYVDLAGKVDKYLRQEAVKL